MEQLTQEEAKAKLASQIAFEKASGLRPKPETLHELGVVLKTNSALANLETELDELRAKYNLVRKALVEMVGVDGKDELDMMEMHIMDMDGERCALMAVKALRETLSSNSVLGGTNPDSTGRK